MVTLNINCAHRGCPNSFPPNAKGRPQEYCSKACRYAAFQARHSAAPGPHPYTLTVVSDLAARVGHLRDLARGDDGSSLTAKTLLRQLAVVRGDLADATTLAIHQARARGVRKQSVADLLEIPLKQARRPTAQELQLLMSQRQPQRSAQFIHLPGGGSPVPGYLWRPGHPG